jgi:hypothetical protein
LSRLLRRFARAAALALGAVAVAFALSVAVVCWFEGIAPTLDYLRWQYVVPAIADLSEARWSKVPGLRLAALDRHELPHKVLVSFFSLVQDKFPREEPVFFQCALPWTCTPNVQGRTFREAVDARVYAWLEGRLPKKPIIDIGPISYRPTEVVLGMSYWPYYGHLGVAIDYACRRRLGDWQCRELSRYAINWPRE